MNKPKILDIISRRTPYNSVKIAKAFRLRTKAKLPELGKNHDYAPQKILMDRLLLIARTGFFIFKVRIRKDKSNTFFLTRENHKESISKRKKFIDYKTETNSQHIDWRKEVAINSLIDFPCILIDYIKNLKSALTLAFDFSPIYYIEVADYLNYSLMLKQKKNCDLYFFFHISPSLYLLSQEKTNQNKINYIYEPTPLFNAQRLDYHKNSRIIFTSKVLLNEVSEYASRNMLTLDNCEQEYWGNMYEIPPKKEIPGPKYELGFYSSAWWARDGNIRVYDKEKLMNGHFLNTKEAKTEIKIIEAINSTTNEFKIYLHPFEKELIKKFEIYPPFWEKYKDKISLELDEIVSNLFEPRIAVVQSSSTLYERLDYDLPTFFCTNEKLIGGTSTLKEGYIPDEYKNFAYKTTEELAEKLKDYLSENGHSKKH